MKRRTSAELQDIDVWPAEIGFVPFVGERYDEGIDGKRILLLGESHYISNESEVAKAGGLRRYTQYVFRDCERSLCRAWGTFFRRLDSIVTRTENPADEMAVMAWRHVAFANFVQVSVGKCAGVRPEGKDWEGARQAFPLLLDILAPHVVLVIGRQAFNQTPDAPGRRIGEITVPSSPMPRSLWEMDYDGGRALMSWVYHPARPNDTKAGYVGVFNALLAEAATRLEP